MNGCKLTGPKAAKQAQTMLLPAPFFTVGKFWCWSAVQFFFRVPPKQFNFGFISAQNVLPRVLWSVQCLGANIKTCSNVYLLNSYFLRGVLQWILLLASGLHIVDVCTEILDFASDFCKSSAETRWFFVTTQSFLCWTLGILFGGRPLLPSQLYKNQQFLCSDLKRALWNNTWCTAGNPSHQDTILIRCVISSG